MKDIEMKRELLKAYSIIRKSYQAQIEKFENLESELNFKIDALDKEIFEEEMNKYDRRHYAK